MLLETKIIEKDKKAQRTFVNLTPKNKHLINNLYEFINIILKLRYYNSCIFNIRQIEEKEVDLLSVGTSISGGSNIQRHLLYNINKKSKNVIKKNIKKTKNKKIKGNKNTKHKNIKKTKKI